jgi:hypothetical protein
LVFSGACTTVATSDTRGGIHLVINSVELAGADLRGVGLVVGIDRQRRSSLQTRLDRAEVRLRQREDDGDRPQFRENDDAGGGGGLDVIARIDLSQTDAARHRCRDMAIGDVELVGRDYALIGGNRPRILLDEIALVDDLLNGDGVLPPERFEA